MRERKRIARLLLTDVTVTRTSAASSDSATPACLP
jgi:hypothetical protein